MQVILYIVLFIIALAIACVALCVYGIPMLVVLIAGGVSIPTQRASLIAPNRAFQFLSISPSHSEKPWRVMEDKLESAVNMDWLKTLGWVCTAIPTLVIVAHILSSMDDIMEVITSVAVAVAGVWAGVAISQEYPKWTQQKIVKCVTKDLESGVAGLEHALELRKLSGQVNTLFAESLGTTPPDDRAEVFFDQLASGSTDNCHDRILSEIDGTKHYVKNLQNAINSHRRTLQLYQEVSRSVNRAALGSLIAEMDDIYTGLHSEQLYDLIRTGSWDTYHEIIDSLNSDLDRIAHLANQPESRSTGDRASTVLTHDDALEILGVGPDDSLEEMKRRHRALVKQLHPDTKQHLPDDEVQKRATRFKRVQLAWEILNSKEVV